MSLRFLTAGLITLQALAISAPAALAAPAATAAATPLTVQDGQVAEAPPGAKVMAAFMTLRNPGKQTVTIKGASSPDFAKVEIHETRRQGEMASMVALNDLAIPAGGSVTLAHGGKHLMLFTPKRTLQVGDTVSVTFQLDGGKNQTVQLTVKAHGSGQSHDHHGGHEGHGH